MSVRPLTTAIHCFDLIELIATKQAPVRLAEAARLSGHSRATTYQRLLTLTTAGWLERLPDESYRLSLSCCRIANAALQQAGLDTRALPVLQELTDATGETSSLVALENGRPVIVQRVEAGGVLRADLQVGAELSFQDSASGKVWLVFSDDLQRKPIHADDVDSLNKRERQSIVAAGYATGGGGKTLPGISVIAAPVFDDYDRCLASVSLVGPESRFKASLLKQPLLEAAAELHDVFAGRLVNGRQ